jgi:hypothetical protein
MLVLDLLAERRIEEALARGELGGLPGAGRPLELDDDALVPEELRIAFRILKNAGLVPPEVEARRTIADLERMVMQSAEADAQARSRAARKLALLRTRVERDYYGRVLKRLGGA